MANISTHFSDTHPITLFGGTAVDALTSSVTLAADQGTLRKGAVLGKAAGELGAITPGSNTGNGTLTGVEVGPAAISGSYVLTCTEEAANGGAFSVIDPNGNALVQATVGAAYSSPHLIFQINDGSTDFVVGDSFIIAVTAASEYVLAAAGVVASFVLATDEIDTDEEDAELDVVVYKRGLFNYDALYVAQGDTVENHKGELEANSIYYKTEHLKGEA